MRHLKSEPEFSKKLNNFYLIAAVAQPYIFTHWRNSHRAMNTFPSSQRIR